MFAALLLSVLLLAAEPTAAPQQETPADTTTQTENLTPKPDEGRLVCKRESKANSRFTTKVCKTVAEWEARAEAARQSFTETQNRQTTLVCPPSGC